ncbi:vacuolar fusion protein CCZ1 homolog isoform X2 [Nematostella vectensis]|uniref:vacuolar fusion protein CCZ1 homolog isoform X2 n=1 Tax=Nematostella vectensis TaxID=45351 RepID=UPI00138FB9F7|nr:vacuolar fusion protein CCZ1 homolog isoform X2 [Nematostella vectensis]
MAAMKTTPGLVNFFIFNSTYGPREGEEHEKIILYIPTEEDIDRKIKTIGLCEALVKFTETFAPDKPCESLHTQKSRQIFYQPEPDFWMIMTISIPFSEKIAKDGKNTIEYHYDDVLDNVLDAVLKQSYKMFKLFNGPFNYLSETYGREALKKRSEYFFLSYLQTLNFSSFDLLDIFAGIQFLPLDKNTFLKIQSFVNLIEHTFSQIKYTAFLYSDKLVWSGLEQEDMRILYKYLVTSLFPATIDSELADRSSQGYVVIQPKSHHGRFVTGPPDLKDIPTPRKPPRIFVNTDTEQEELLLICYKALDATICLLVSAPFPTLDFFKKLDMFIGPQLTTLANVICEQSSKKSLSSDQQYRYIYFNHMNLAQKSTIHSKKASVAGVSPEIMRLLGDISADFNSFQEDGETYVKTMSDCWVVGRKSDQREFFVILNQKSANLIEING